MHFYVYIMKNYKIDDTLNQYMLYDATCRHCHAVKLTPDQAEVLPLKAISPAEMFAKLHGKDTVQ